MGASVTTLQTNFNAGEIDPLLASRVDIEQYFQGAKTLRNVLVLPQGGVRRRPGLEFLHEFAGDIDTARLIPFEYGPDNSKYLFVFTDARIDIFEDDALVDSWTEAGDVGTTYTEAQLASLTWVQNDEILIVFQENNPPRQFLRGDTSWAATGVIEDIPWRAIPQHHFPDTTGVATSHVHEIKFLEFTNNTRFTLFVNGEETASIAFLDDNAALMVNLDAGIEAVRGVGSGGVAIANPQGENYTLTFGGANTIGREFTVTEGNIGFDEGTTVNDRLNDIVVTKGAPSKEDVWSVARGFPSCGAFFQGRLWMAGSTQRPQTIWASQSNAIYSFNDEEDLADFAINVTIDGATELAQIRQMFVGRHLQIFSSEAEYYIPESDTKIVTPQTIVVRRTTHRGIKSGSQIFDVDGATFFLDAANQSLRRFVFDDAEQSYTAENLSLLSSHLMTSSTDIAYRKSKSTDEADYVLVRNSDSTLSIYCTLFSQNVSAWTKQHTRGNFSSVAVLNGEMYFAVRRGNATVINGSSRMMLEKFNQDRLFDSSLAGTGVASSVTLSHLAGVELATPLAAAYGDEMVGAVIDGNVMDEDKVTTDYMGTGGSSGVFTFIKDSVSTWEVGLWFGAPGSTGFSVADILTESAQDEVLIRTLPFESGELGSLFGRKIRIKDVTIRMNETQQLKVQNSEGSSLEEILFRQLPEVLDSAAPSFTGDKRIKGMLGRGLSPTLDLIQSTSLKMQILGLSMRLVV